MKSDELDLDLEERRILRDGYGGLEPPSAKKDFILGALSVRLPGALGPAPPESLAPGSEPGGLAPGGLAPGGLSGALTAKLVAGALVVGALGFGLGTYVSRRESTGPRVVERRSTAAALTVRDRGAQTIPDGLPLDALDAEPDLPAAAFPPERGGAGSARSRRAGGKSEAPAPISFYEELSYIRRAQTALANGNPALALGLMGSLKELRSDGALLAERGVTEVLALCALDRQAEARVVADGVRGRSDGSMYVGRLEKTCAGATEPSDSGDDPHSQATSTEQTQGR